MPGYANPQNLNRYSYVTNNPLRYTDPTGHMRVDDEGGGGNKGCSDPKYCNNGKPKSKDELDKMRNEKKDKDENQGPLESIVPEGEGCQIQLVCIPNVNIDIHVTSDWEARGASGIISGIVGVITAVLFPNAGYGTAFTTGFGTGLIAEELALPGSVEGDVTTTISYPDPDINNSFSCYGSTFTPTISSTTVTRDGNVIVIAQSSQGYCIQR